MSNEKPIEGNNWRDRLNGLGELPEAPWKGREAAWDRLEDRLRPRTGSRRKAWWPAAAVFLLLAATAFLIARQGNRDSLVKRQALPAPPRLTTPVPASVTAPAHNISAAPAFAAALPKQPAKHPAVAHAFHMAPVAKDSPAFIPVTAAALPAAGTPLLAIVRPLATSPKKLRVVHLNELEQPVPAGAAPTSVQTNDYTKRYFRLLLIGTDKASNAAATGPATDNSSRLLIKIHLQN